VIFLSGVYDIEQVASVHPSFDLHFHLYSHELLEIISGVHAIQLAPFFQYSQRPSVESHQTTYSVIFFHAVPHKSTEAQSSYSFDHHFVVLHHWNIECAFVHVFAFNA
jgi:hypothetical protein